VNTKYHLTRKKGLTDTIDLKPINKEFYK